MVQTCGIIGCKTNYDTLQKLQETFFPVPISNPKLKEKWLNVLKLKSIPPASFKVCSKHFSERDFLRKNCLLPTAVPSLYLPSSNMQNIQTGVFKINLPMSFYDYQKQFALKFNSKISLTPQEEFFNNKRKLENSNLPANKKPKLTIKNVSQLNSSILPVISNIQSLANSTHINNNDTSSEVLTNSIPIIDLDDYPDYEDAMGVPFVPDVNIKKEPGTSSPNLVESNSKETQTYAEQGIFTRYLTYSREEIEYYTGLQRNRFEILVNLIKRDNVEFTCKTVSLHDQLMITLFRYRHNCHFNLMHFIFKVPVKDLPIIFQECSNSLYNALEKINFWNTSKRNKGTMIIVETINFPVVPSNNAQYMQRLKSNGNSVPTFKLLVACDEYGLTLFVSETYGGAMPDRNLFIESKFFNKMPRNEGIITCQEFKVDDLMQTNKIKIKLRAYGVENAQNGKKKISLNVSNLKEQSINFLIQGVKENKILAEPIPIAFWPIANNIIKNCFYLNNLRNKALNTIVMKK